MHLYYLVLDFVVFITTNKENLLKEHFPSAFPVYVNLIASMELDISAEVHELDLDILQ